MDFTYILHSALPKTETFADFGFEKSADTEGQFVLKKALSGDAADFFVSMTLSDSSLIAEVFDSTTGEKYALFDSPRAHGSFVAELREQVQRIAEDFRLKCFVTDDLRPKYTDWIQNHFSCKADFPWKPKAVSQKARATNFKSDIFGDYAVFRCPNQKWFALVMKIKYSNLGLKSDESVFVVNLKADSEQIPKIIDKKSIFPAYHMNKKHWITVLLTAVTDFDRLCELTERSFELVQGKRKIIKSVNINK